MPCTQYLLASIVYHIIHVYSEQTAQQFSLIIIFFFQDLINNHDISGKCLLTFFAILFYLKAWSSVRIFWFLSLCILFEISSLFCSIQFSTDVIWKIITLFYYLNYKNTNENNQHIFCYCSAIYILFLYQSKATYN